MKAASPAEVAAATPASAPAAKDQEAQPKSSEAEESYYSEEFDEEEEKEKDESGDEPHFQSRSGRRKSAESGDGTAKVKKTGSGRNSAFHKEKLRTIEEDDSE